MAELTEKVKENRIRALLSLEVREVIRAPSIYFSMNSLALLCAIDESHFQIVKWLREIIASPTLAPLSRT